MRGNIDTEPCYVDSRTIVDSDGSQKCSEVFDSVVVDCEQKDVADDTENVRKQEELKRVSSEFVRSFISPQMQEQLTGDRRTNLSDATATRRKQTAPNMYTGMVR